jgi:hypothetical protein
MDRNAQDRKQPNDYRDNDTPLQVKHKLPFQIGFFHKTPNVLLFRLVILKECSKRFIRNPLSVDFSQRYFNRQPDLSTHNPELLFESLFPSRVGLGHIW